jgi:hypothetical protein
VIVGTYWALTVGLGLAIGKPESVMAISGRTMIGLIFLFAATWKWATPDFRDGSFFSLYLLADPRFKTLADLIGGIGGAGFGANRTLIGSLYEVGGTMTDVTLELGSRIRPLAAAMTYWGLAIETFLAAAWLAPIRDARRWLRHLALFAFCATTYGLVAITGFGTILLVMGMATSQDLSRWRVAYGVGVAALAVWTPVWSQLLA